MTRVRIVSTLFLALFVAPAVFAAFPSARTGTRMVYDPVTTFSYLYGGLSAVDAGTGKAYDIDETWAWTGDRWIQMFPASTPGGRSYHAMTFDAALGRVLLFGGKTLTTYHNDTWTFDGTNWAQIETANAPSPRIWSGLTFDRDRNVAVLYGGQFTTSDGKTTTQYYDTWEFDGTNWKQVSTGDGPKVTTPLLAYDAADKKTYMLGSDTSAKPHFYAWNSDAKSWTEVTPSTMPDCVVDAGLTYDEGAQKLVLYSGTCSSSGTTGETFEWDGSNWSHVTPDTILPRLTGEAITYDAAREKIVVFGGTEAFAAPVSSTNLYSGGVWTPASNNSLRPAPRSLAVFVTDPTNGVVWLYGGQNDDGTLDDLWSYSNGQWQRYAPSNEPTACGTPNGVWDTDRHKLVVICEDSSVHEWDGTAWTNVDPSTQKKKPQVRRFSSAAYDQTLHRTVLFGGYNESSYIKDTWLWDGTSWTQITRNLPYQRTLAAMWYDPTLKKTLIYGGVGQQDNNARIERFSDMWSFDGSGWTQMKSVTSTPGLRYAAQVLVDPTTNLVYLVGGLRLIVNGLTQTQEYANDTWKWDGTQWTQVTTGTVLPARENFGFAWDPVSSQPVLFGGFSGFYRSDLWSFRGGDWALQAEQYTPLVIGRRHGRP